LIALISLVFLAFVGCDDDPVGPDDTTTLPASADAAVEAFFTALADGDSTVLEAVLAPGFVFDSRRHATSIGVEALNRAQTMRALSNLCIRDDETLPCPIDGIIAEHSLPDSWELIEYEETHVPTYRAGINIQIDVLRTNCYLDPVYGRFTVLIEEHATGGQNDETHFLISGITDHTYGKSSAIASMSFSELLSIYLPVGLPHPRLSADADAGTTDAAFALDAGATTCGGLGLPVEPFRWLVDGVPSTGWTDESLLDITFTEPGDHVVDLEVRNTLGWSWTISQQIHVVASWPRNSAELLATFAYAHESQDVMLFSRCLAPSVSFSRYSDRAPGEPKSEVRGFADLLDCAVDMFSDVVREEYVQSIMFSWVGPQITPAPDSPKLRSDDPTQQVEEMSLVLVRPNTDHLSAGGPVFFTTLELESPAAGHPVTVFGTISEFTGSSAFDPSTTWSNILDEYPGGGR